MAELRICVLSGAPVEERRYPLTAPLSIGRTPESDIVLDGDLAVSRNHARVVQDAEGWAVVDSGGANGTYVNGYRVTRRALVDGDLVRVGRTTLRFVDEAGPRCPRCGVAMEASARFCGGCGHALTSAVPTAAPSPSPGAAPERSAAAPQLPAPARPRRSCGALTLVGLLLVVGAGAVVWFRYGQSRKVPTSARTADQEEASAGWSGALARLDLAAGGTVELEGITVTVPSGSGSGQGQVAVRRRERDPGESLGTPLTSTYEVELRSNGEAQSKLKQPVHLALPVLPGVDDGALAQARIVIRTRPSAGGAWRVENAMPRYHAPSRRILFSLPHLSVIAGEQMDKRPTLHKAPAEGGYTSPTGLVQVNYLVDGQHSPRSDWTPLFEHAGASDAPAYVRDLALYLEQALAQLFAIRTRGGTNLFNPRKLPSRPLQTYVADVGSGATGISPIGGPLTISNRLGVPADPSEPPPAPTAAMAGNAAHELVHVLQGQLYRLPSRYILMFGNRWFIEATATYYARRAFPALLGSDWYFKMSQQYLKASLFADEERSYYAAGHFLEWLDGRVGDGTVATAMSTPDLWDSRALVTAVNAAKGPAFADLYAEYCRGMFIGRLAPAGRFTPPTVSLALSSKGRSLLGDARVGRAPMSASAVEVTAVHTAGARGLLVIEPDAAVDLRQYTYRVGLGDPEQYFERPEVGRTVLLRKDRFKALRDVGDTASLAQLRQVGLLLVNNGERDLEATFRFWLLLPPHDVRLEQGSLLWEQPAQGLTGILAGHNIYLDGKRLNDAPIDGGSFSHPALQAAKDTTGLVVTVVDRVGFEWPEPPAAATTGALVFSVSRTEEERTNAGPVTITEKGQIRIQATRLTGSYSMKRVLMRGSRGRESLEIALELAGTYDEKTGKLEGTVSGADRGVETNGRTKSWPRKGRFSGEVRGEKVTIQIKAEGGMGRYTATFAAKRLSDR